jgi:hypothetical protein
MLDSEYDWLDRQETERSRILCQRRSSAYWSEVDREASPQPGAFGAFGSSEDLPDAQ